MEFKPQTANEVLLVKRPRTHSLTTQVVLKQTALLRDLQHNERSRNGARTRGTCFCPSAPFYLFFILLVAGDSSGKRLRPHRC